jgi:hypothetical protein
MKFLETWKEPPKSRLVKSLTNLLLNSFHVNYQIYNFCQTTVLLEFDFGRRSPYSHQTIAKIRGGEISFPVYYFLFSVRNKGRRPAEDCEAVLERVWSTTDPDNSREWQSFIPLNLKWSGENPSKDFRGACLKTIYPGERKVFCDIGRIKHPAYQDKSDYARISEEKDKRISSSLNCQEDYTVSGIVWCLETTRYKSQFTVGTRRKKPERLRFIGLENGKVQKTRCLEKL